VEDVPVSEIGEGRGGAVAAPPRFRTGFPGSWAAFLLLLPYLIAGTAVVAEAGTATLAVSATVLTKSNCLFSTRTATLDFGALDPANPVNATANATIPFVCRGSAPIATFAVSGDGGRYSSGPGNRRMRHATNLSEFLPYTMTLSPASGTVPKNAAQTLTVTGTVLGSDFRGALAGSYADTVVLSILP
jgi:spore coat protein U-like protein